jgi:predicted acyl esterase
LLYDRRGEAASEGDPNAVGWDRATDVEAGIAFLQQQPDVDPERIGGIGFSVGGEMLLEAAATSDDLKAVVSEGAGVRSYKEALELDGVEGWLAKAIWMSTTAGIALFSGTTPPENLKELVQEIAPRPVMFIYADRPQGGEELSAEYYEVAGEPKELWKTDSTHVAGYDSDPAEYSTRVIEFFDNSLL